ncbi:MAG: DUF1499 domain-containing protein [Mariprofundaceae bacterium]|nr:DUF1499 domain-containing protein [Mariprofundaceae bacterium]
MKVLGIIVIILLVVGLLAYIIMAILSQKQPDNLGLQHAMLQSCPNSPNCVCSESHSQSDAQHFITPIVGNEKTWLKLKQLVSEQGGVIQLEHDNYMHFTFSTPIFHYVDDVEFRFDRSEGLIHMRSASRIGRSDFGVNRKRMESIKKALGGHNEH